MPHHARDITSSVRLATGVVVVAVHVLSVAVVVIIITTSHSSSSSSSSMQQHARAQIDINEISPPTEGQSSYLSSCA